MFAALFFPFIHIATTVNAQSVVNFVVENKSCYVVLEPRKTRHFNVAGLSWIG